MVSRSPKRVQKIDVKYYSAMLYEIEDCDLSDTIPFGDFNGDDDLKKCVLMNQSDGSEVTCTISKNVATITGAGSSMDLIAMVFGRLA